MATSSLHRAQPQISQNDGFVMGLNNYYQNTLRTNAAVYVTYSFVGPRPGDIYTATVTLVDRNASYSATGVGKRAAKEAAAREAMRALGLTR